MNRGSNPGPGSCRVDEECGPYGGGVRRDNGRDHVQIYDWRYVPGSEESVKMKGQFETKTQEKAA